MVNTFHAPKYNPITIHLPRSVRIDGCCFYAIIFLGFYDLVLSSRSCLSFYLLLAVLWRHISPLITVLWVEAPHGFSHLISLPRLFLSHLEIQSYPLFWKRTKTVDSGFCASWGTYSQLCLCPYSQLPKLNIWNQTHMMSEQSGQIPGSPNTVSESHILKTKYHAPWFEFQLSQCTIPADIMGEQLKHGPDLDTAPHQSLCPLLRVAVMPPLHFWYYMIF